MNTDEKWASVPDFEGLYDVSTNGRVYSIRRTIERTDGTKMTCGGVMLRLFRCNKRGPLSVNLKYVGTERICSVPRIMLMAFEGVPQPGYVASPYNGNNDDLRLENWRFVREDEVLLRAAKLGHASKCVISLEREAIIAGLPGAYGDGKACAAAAGLSLVQTYKLRRRAKLRSEAA